MTLNDRRIARVRRMCLALLEVHETSAWGHPNFKAGARTFVAIEWINQRPSIALRQTPTEIDLLLRRQGFFVTPYGRGQWVSAWVDASTDWGIVEHLLQRSYRLVALKRMVAALDAVAGRG